MRNERLEWLIRNRPELTLDLLKWLWDQIVSRNPDSSVPTLPTAANTRSGTQTSV